MNSGPAAELIGTLDQGERLEGTVFASQQLSPFSGRSVAIGVTSKRLLVQPLDRRGRPKGDRIAILPGQVNRLDGGPAGGGWATLGSAVLDNSAVRLRLETSEGETFKLMLMSGEGMFGRFAGEGQGDGATALGEWLARIPGA